MMMVATALIAWTSVLAKAVGTGFGGDELHPLQISAGRFSFAFLALIPAVAWMRPTFRGAAWRLHVGRVISGWGGVTLFFAAASQIPLADANAIGFLSPIFTMALSVLFLRESVRSNRWWPAALSLAGAIILARPGTDTFQPAALLALGSAVMVGTEVTFIKRLSDTEPAVRILTISNGFGTMVSVPIALFFWTQPSLLQIATLAWLGTTMLCAQVLFVQANRRADASFLAPLFYITPLFAATYDWLLFSQPVTAISALGIATIIAGAIWLARASSRR